MVEILVFGIGKYTHENTRTPTRLKKKNGIGATVIEDNAARYYYNNYARENNAALKVISWGSKCKQLWCNKLLE